MSARRRLLTSVLVLAAFGIAQADPKPKAAKKPAATKKPAAAATTKKPAVATTSKPKKRVRIRRAAPRSLSEAYRRMARIRVNLEFKEATLTQIAEYVGAVADFNVIVAPALQAKGLDEVGTVTFKLKQVTLKQVVTLTAQMTGTSIKLENGILQFTTKKDARGKPVLRIYSIAVLTAPIRNFPGPDLNLRPAGSEWEREEITEVENSFSDPERVAEMVRELVEPASWEDEKVSIATLNNKLVVRTYKNVHRKIAALLAKLRASR